MNDLAVTPQNALATLEKQDTPEAKAILDYVQMIKSKNIAVLGADECFILEDASGQIKGFKRALALSVQDGTLVKPGYGNDMPHIVSAQGYEVWAEATGTSVIFPREVLVGSEWKPNPYAERDPNNRRILAVHASAIAFGYSSMGIPRVSAWTTIFDTPSYRMIDLLAKAKQFPQAFRVLPVGMEPEKEEKGAKTWAHYPFDESMNLWIDTSHNEVIKWLSQILNREKKAMDFAQTFAKRNALKHLSGIQKAPANQWKFSVIAWRPTGNNVIKWDAAQYANLQDRVAGMIEGSTSNEFTDKAEIMHGSERTSEDEYSEAIEADTDPEDSQEPEEKTPAQDTKQPEEKQESATAEPSKEVKQAVQLSKSCPAEFDEACKILKINPTVPLGDKTAVMVCQKVAELVDAQN